MGSKICPYKLIFCPEEDETKWLPFTFLKKNFGLLEFGVKVFLDSGRWDEWQTFENLFSLDFEKVNWFYNKKKEYASFILLYLWAKYEPIWLNFTGKTVIFSAYGVWTAIYYFQFNKN